MPITHMTIIITNVFTILLNNISPNLYLLLFIKSHGDPHSVIGDANFGLLVDDNFNILYNFDNTNIIFMTLKDTT